MAMGRQRSASENPFYRALNGLLGVDSTTLEATRRCGRSCGATTLVGSLRFYP